MNETPLALLLVSAVARREATSALPHAPVVPHVPTISLLSRVRAAVATGLRRTADVLAPVRVAGPTPARSAAHGEAC